MLFFGGGFAAGVSEEEECGEECYEGSDGVAEPAGEECAEAFFFGDEEETGSDHGHEHGREQGDDVGFAFEAEEDGDGPEGDGGEYLVAPGEVAPDDVEAFAVEEGVYKDTGGDGEEGYGYEEAVFDGFLFVMEEVGHNETGGAQGGVAGGDGCGDDAEDADDGDDFREPGVGDNADHGVAAEGCAGFRVDGELL